ncbi:hypothetical protein DFH06DRAFT_1328234 [Mycena polygramma]|nr:hypothetical protein DFH06DRAFT_1328234 [Mycena polygramma]
MRAQVPLGASSVNVRRTYTVLIYASEPENVVKVRRQMGWVLCTDGRGLQDSRGFETVRKGASNFNKGWGVLVVKKRERSGVEISLGTLKQLGSQLRPALRRPPILYARPHLFFSLRSSRS